MEQKTNKGHGYFRKSKAYGLVSGLILGAVFLSSGTGVSADEVVVAPAPEVAVVTTSNPATNLVEAQETSSPAHATLAHQSGQTTGELVSPVTSQELEVASQSAKESGVALTEGKEPLVYDSLEKAQNDLKTQAQAVSEATAKQENNTTIIKEAVAENERIAQLNAAEIARVDKLNAEGQATVDEANRKGQAETEAYNNQEKARVAQLNADLKADYEAKMQAVKDVEAYNEGVRQRNAAAQAAADAENARRQAEYERLLSEAQAKTSQEGYLSTVEHQALSVRHSTAPKVEITNLSGVTFDKHTITKENGSHAGFVFGHGEATTNPAEAFSPGYDPYNGDKEGGSYHLYSETGQFSFTATYTNVDGVTHAGQAVSKIVYDVSVNQNGPSTIVAYEDPADFFEWAMHGQKDLSLTVSPRYYDVNGNRIDLVGNSLFYIESLENNINGLNAIEKVSGTGGSFLLVNGSSIKQHGNEYYSDVDNWTGDTKGNWFRSVVFKPTSNDFSLTFTKTASILDSYIWVGMQTSLKINDVIPPKKMSIEPEKENPVPATPPVPNWVSPDLKTFTPATYTPIDPELLPPVTVPEKETFSATTHPVLVKQTPGNYKTVVNSDGVDVNGKTVPKGSTETWVLTNSALKAGREQITSYVMTDPFPAGFEVDLLASQIRTQGWTFLKDSTGRTILVATSATLASINADRTVDVAIPPVYVVGRPLNDGGTYANTFQTIIATPSGQYTITSNTPEFYTPGGGDKLIVPEKDVVDTAGHTINGQSVLPNSTLNYIAKHKLTPYQGIEAGKLSIAKGFAYADDYLDEALDGKSLVVNSIVASNGDDVTNLLEMYHVLSTDTLSEKLQALVKDSGISPVGEFYFWVAKDPQAFYEAYVKKGLDITYNLSFKIKESFTEGQVTNQTFQIDFGNGYYGNVVTNDVPPILIHKDVLNSDGQSIDGKTVKIGDKVTYKLEGWVIPAGRGYDIDEYRFVDVLQSSHDKFDDYAIKSSVAITLSDGTVIPAGEDLKAYTETIYNAATGTFELRFKQSFTDQVPRASEFGANAYITVERIAAGEVVNEYTLYVNGNPVTSNKVTTDTPEPPTPPTSDTPSLPNTGEGSGALLSLMGGLTTILGLVGYRRKANN